jgi:hypothetical protein
MDSLWLALRISVFYFIPALGIPALGILAAEDSIAISKNGFILDGASIPIDEIVHGGPGRGGIPAINTPKFVTRDDAGFLAPEDRVLGVFHSGIARAYPVRILNYHEVVNDVFHDISIVITYCPLCGSGMAFYGSIADRRLIFGVSGLLYNSDVLLYDLQTQSLWSQIKSTAVSGTMNGTKLVPIPISHTTWRDWKLRHPNSRVLSTETGFQRDYQENPYPDYESNARILFPVTARSRKYRQKALIMGLEIDGRFKAYPFEELERNPGQFTDEFQGEKFEVHYDDENRSARIFGEDGSEIPTVTAYWFAWYAFHPDTTVYKAE